jgi:hypothetical protein
MKNPKALFPFLFASSFFGNLVLTLLAFYLAFTHSGPLTPLVFLTVALCILSGNALPIGVYLILVRWNEAELRAEAAEANLRLRDALARSEEVMGRLDEAEGALAKGIIVARQVPERISEQFKPLVALSEKFEAMDTGSFAEALATGSGSAKAFGDGLATVQKTVAELQSGLKDVRKDLKDVPASVEKLLQKAEAEAGGDPDALDISVGERLDLVFETLETVQDSLDGLLQRVAEIRIPVEPQLQQEDNPEPESEPEEEPAETIGEPVDEPGEPVEAEPEHVDEVAEQPEPEPEAKVEPEPEPEPEVKKKKPARKRARKGARKQDTQEEMELGGDAAVEPASGGDGQTRLIVHAMVGISNKLYIRGDEPWLSWDDGQQMELIGIGEYAWSMDDLKEPIDVTVLLNDETASEEGTIRLEPGETRHVSPRFQR